MSESCLFCKIIQGTIPASKLYEDDHFICIRDIHPQAKIHLLVLPKEHLASLAEAFPVQEMESGRRELKGKADLLGKLFETATKIAHQQGLLPGGFRAVINTDRNGGQTIFHLHLHLLGGEVLKSEF